MFVQHVAIDGSQIIIEADGNLETGATTSGWAIVPSLMRTHPFTSYPPGHSRIIEENVLENFPTVKVLNREEFSLKGGDLRTAEIELPSATGGTRQLTVGAWEGERGCLTTSLTGFDTGKLVEAFDSLEFSERDNGLAIDSPVTSRPRVPELTKEILDLAVLGIRPATESELEQVPRENGMQVEYGELFRIREGGRALYFVNDTVVTRVNPLPETETERLLNVVASMRIEWLPSRR